MSRNFYYLMYILICLVKIVSANKIVKTTHGQISGKVMKTLLKEVDYFSYTGIPYAAPPVNNLRFLPPQPVVPWQDVLTATKEKSPCIQYNNNVKKGQPLGYYGEEDCLYLDIFTPNTDAGKRPIIVFLHNEYLRYSYNKTKDYAPDFFIEEDVVITTISHRLAVFGFLSFEDDVLRGNSGLKDIVAGLEWIANNAERFGGDPNRITLMGSQGGAAAVDLLIHSNAKRFFNSAILQGGTSWTSMFLQDNARERAIKLAEKLQIAPGTSTRLLTELSGIAAGDLLKKELEAVPTDYNKKHQRSLLPFGPVVEPDGLVDDYPERSTGMDIPIMIGFNSRDGLEKSLQYLIEPKYLSFVEKDFVLIMPKREDFRFDPEDDVYDEAVKDIKKFYFPKKRVTIKSISEYVTYIGDIFTVPINDMVNHYSNVSLSPVYYYYFDYYSDLSENKCDLMKMSSVQDGTWGAASGDELCYLFKCPTLKEKYLTHYKSNSEEIEQVKKMVKMWSNFAKYEYPTPKGDYSLRGLHWPPYTTEYKKYLHIGKNVSVKQDLCKARFQFWTNFVKKWRRRAVNGVVSHTKNKKDEF